MPRAPVGWPETGRPIVVAGLRPPRGSDVLGFVERARELAAAGADMLAIIDPEPSSTQVGPVAAAVLLSERVGTAVILQVEAAGRSLAALQADLLGAHAFGLHTVVCRTGSPRAAGDYPWTSASPTAACWPTSQSRSSTRSGSRCVNAVAEEGRSARA